MSPFSQPSFKSVHSGSSKPLSYLLLCCITLSTTASFAQTLPAARRNAAVAAKDPKAKGYQHAQELFDQKRFAEALIIFRAVAKDLNSPNAMFMAARCLIGLERWVEAWKSMGIAIDLAERRSKSAPRYLQTRDAAAAQRQLLTSKIGRLTLAIAEPPKTLKVIVNGRIKSLDSLGKILGFAPGKIQVEAEADGFVPFSKELSLRGGENRTLVLNLVPKNRPTPTPQTIKKPLSPLVIAGGILGGLGLLGFGTFGVAGILANNDYETLKQSCTFAPCTDPRANELADRGELLDLSANIGLAVGIAGVAVGTTLIVAGSFTTSSQELALQVGPGSIRLRGTF